MKPIRLTLSGFKGIEDGLGLPSFTIDLGERSGLIALKGRNGRGKSTIIDNLHPYRLMPSRVEGATYSPKSASFYDCISAEGATKDLLWEYEGRQYRSLISWKNTGRSRSCTAYLFEVCGGIERPYQLRDGVGVDGKTDVYDRAVEEILGPPEVFFTSAFSAQGKQPISAMQPGDAKRWLGNLLNQSPIRALAERARTVAKLLSQALQAIRASAGEVSTIARSLRENETASGELKARVDQLQQQVTAAEEGVITARAAKQAQEQSEAGLAAHAEALRRGQQAVADALSRESVARSALQQADASDAVASNQAQRTEAALLRSQAATREEIDRQVRSATALLERASKIRDSQARREALQQQLRQREDEQIPALRKLLEAEGQHRQQQQLAETRLTDLRVRYREIQLVDSRAKLANRVPCAGSELNSTCELLADARKAQSEYPQAEALLKSLEQDGKTAAADIDTLKRTIAALNEPATLLRSAESMQRQDREALRALDHVPAEVAALANAEQQRADAQQRLAAWEPTAATELASVRSGEESRKKAFVTTRAQLQSQLDACVEQSRAAQQALDALPVVDPEAGRRAALRVTEAEKALYDARERRGAVERDLAANQVAHATILAQLALAQRKSDQAARLEAEIAVWTLLAEALGDKGIIALEIDAAGPSIAAEANRLLSECYDARFSVELKTQVETGKGEVREGFDIVVHDANTNDTRSMTALSGGQRVWVNEAIIRSVAVYLAQAGQRRYQTLFTDEVDGALDPARKHAYMQMKLALLRLGLFDREVFITQTPELLQYADRVIDLDALATTP